MATPGRPQGGCFNQAIKVGVTRAGCSQMRWEPRSTTSATFQPET